MTESTRIARAMYQSGLLGDDWPLPSEMIQDLDAAGAYQIQHGYVAELLRSAAIAPRRGPPSRLLSGSLGSPHPGQPGRYVGDFGGFGQVAFEVI